MNPLPLSRHLTRSAMYRNGSCIEKNKTSVERSSNYEEQQEKSRIFASRSHASPVRLRTGEGGRANTDASTADREKMEDAIVPTEPPTTETKEATEDYSTVNENDVIHAEIESAAIDNNRHLIVTDKNQKQHDKGYVGGDENVRGYVVSFLDYDGTPVKVEIVEKNGSATPPVPPKHTELNFLAWEGSWENIQGDTVITASYTPLRNLLYCALL